jgi:hypothetical protein
VENADYLMEVMGAWQQHYQRAVYIDLGISNGSNVEKKAQDEAARRGWSFERLAGDLNLIRDLLEGNWQEMETQANQRFLIVPPGQRVSMTYDERVIDCENKTINQTGA